MSVRTVILRTKGTVEETAASRVPLTLGREREREREIVDTKLGTSLFDIYNESWKGEAYFPSTLELSLYLSKN